MSDTTQRLRTNHIVRFSSFLVYILYDFLSGADPGFWNGGHKSSAEGASIEAP